MDQVTIGVVSSGLSDFFGPLVFAAVAVGPQEEEKVLAHVGGRPSDDACLVADDALRQICAADVVIISPAKFNEIQSRSRGIERILVWGYAQAVQNLVEKTGVRSVSLAGFEDVDSVADQLAARGLEVEITHRPTTDPELCLRAASLVARAECVRRLRAKSAQLGIYLPRGANENSVEAGAQVVRKHGKDALRDAAKLNFKTLQSVFRRARQPSDSA